MVDLSKTILTINVNYDREYDSEDNEICEKMLEYFTFLRPHAKVSITGVSDRYARNIERKVTSHELTENINSSILPFGSKKCLRISIILKPLP